MCTAFDGENGRKKCKKMQQNPVSGYKHKNKMEKITNWRTQIKKLKKNQQNGKKEGKK